MSLVIIAAFVSVYVDSSSLVFFVFILTLIAYILRDYSCRILLSTGVLLLIIATFNVLTGNGGQAVNTGEVAFFFLATGISGELLRYLPSRNLPYRKLLRYLPSRNLLFIDLRSMLEKIKRQIIISDE